MGKGIIRLEKLTKQNNKLAINPPSLVNANIESEQKHNVVKKVTKFNSIMIYPPSIFLNNSKRRNKEDLFECVNVMIFYTKLIRDDQENVFCKKVGFKKINSAKLGINAWVQINSGPLNGLDSKFGIELLNGLNKISGSNATHIINPFLTLQEKPYDCNSLNPIEVDRWFIADVSIEVDW